MKEQDLILSAEEQEEMRKANEEFKEHKKRKHAEMVALQSLPFPVKLKKAMARIDEFIAECDGRGLNYHISVGGLDSIALLLLIRHMGYGADRVPAISVSGIEDVSIIKIHKKLGVIPIRPMRGKAQVIKEFGFPVISKKITNKIDTLQNPSEKTAPLRQALGEKPEAMGAHHAQPLYRRRRNTERLGRGS